MKAEELETSKTATGAMRAWWMVTSGKGVDDERRWEELPVGVVLREFYRAQATQLRRLEGNRANLDKEDAAELKRLERFFAPAPPKRSMIEVLESRHIPRGEFYDEDPIFDSWVQMVRTGNIPTSWFGKTKGKKTDAEPTDQRKFGPRPG